MQKKIKRCWRSAWRHLSSIMEAMWWSGGSLVVVKCEICTGEKGTLKKKGYHSILQRHAIPCGRRLIGANFLLQQDNDTKHSTKLCKNHLGKKQSAGILSIMSISCCGSSLTVWYVRSAHQANPTCERYFRKHGVKSLQITSTNWQLECQKSARL